MALVKKQNSQWDWYYSETSDDQGINKGILTGLDSNATTKSQPSWNMTAWNNTINGANPSSPSTNNATRRTQYAMENLRDYMWNIGSTTQKSAKWTDIWWYRTTTSTFDTTLWNQKTDTEQTGVSWLISDKKKSYRDELWAEWLKEITDSLEKLWVDATAEAYWAYKTQQAQTYIKQNQELWQLMQQQKYIESKAPNIQKIIDLSEEVAMWLALWKTVQQMATELWQETRVIQKIANWETSELVELDKEYSDLQLRQYLRNEEDLGTAMARNIAQFDNDKKNLDYQFNSAMKNIERALFDAEWSSKTTSAIFWMTGTKYTLDRIRTQYQQQMDDLENTYNYQSANAQMAINNAIEDYTKAIMRNTEDYNEAYKTIQQNVISTMTNVNNQVWLTIWQINTILDSLATDVAKKQWEAITNYLAALESWNTTLANNIARIYGLDTTDLSTRQYSWNELWITRTSTIGNDTNNLWHILASNDGVRIWTYKSPNWYTYNVYATREDWLVATKWLLQRWYYWKTLRDAAQKWIWQWKDISTAISIIKEVWLAPNAKLSDENVEKFMEAIWRREWTLKKWQTLDDWVKEWKTIWWTQNTEQTQEQWLTQVERQQQYENALNIADTYDFKTMKEFYEWITELWKWNAAGYDSLYPWEWKTSYLSNFESILTANWLKRNKWNEVIDAPSEREKLARVYLTVKWIMPAWDKYKSVEDWIKDGWTWEETAENVRTITLSPYYQPSDDQLYSNWLEKGTVPSTIKNDVRYWNTEEERENNFKAAAQSYYDKYTMYDTKYFKEDKSLYDAYLSDKLTDSQKKMLEASKKYWAITWDRLENFYKAAQKYSDEVVQPQQYQTFQGSLDLLVEMKNLITDSEWNLDLDYNERQALRWWLPVIFDSDINSIRNIYNQIKAQSFIDNIIDSKSKWATYWPLSDNEWQKIERAATALDLNNITDEENWTLTQLNIMISDLVQAITELWYVPDVTSWRKRNLQDSITNPNNQNEFDTWWIAYWSWNNTTWTNFTGQQQSWLVNTWPTKMW